MLCNTCMNDDFKIVIFVPNLITHYWVYCLHCDIPVALRSMNLFGNGSYECILSEGMIYILQT